MPSNPTDPVKPGKIRCEFVRANGKTMIQDLAEEDATCLFTMERRIARGPNGGYIYVDEFGEKHETESKPPTLECEITFVELWRIPGLFALYREWR